jgi:hypothetical protein
VRFPSGTLGALALAAALLPSAALAQGATSVLTGNVVERVDRRLAAVDLGALRDLGLAGEEVPDVHPRRALVVGHQHPQTPLRRGEPSLTPQRRTLPQPARRTTRPPALGVAGRLPECRRR